MGTTRPQRQAGLNPPAAEPIEGYRSIKVPAWVYSNWKQAALTLQRQGHPHLANDVLAPDVCPACQGAMRDVTVNQQQYRQCMYCGFTQQNLTEGSKFLGGVVLGIGLTLLLQALSESIETKPKSRRSGRRRS